MKNRKRFLLILSFVQLIVLHGVLAQTNNQEESELSKINRELENPLAKRWSLVFQENFSINQGAIVEGSTFSNTFFFQPALPIPFGKNMVFTARPVFPIVTNADFQVDASGATNTTGFGDIQMAALLGPGNATGWVWGAGASFVFPTASANNLGSGKYQAGPAVMLFLLSKTWTKGVFLQHWWSYAGDESRNNVSRTDLQYVFRRNFGVWSLGLGPTIRIDWEAKSGDKVTFPIGLGYTRTVRIGKVPIKMRLEPQYSIVQPQSIANVWNIRLQIAPVIKSPFISQ